MERKQVESNLLNSGHIKASIDLNVDNTACVLIECGIGARKGKIYTTSLSKEETSKTTKEVTELLLYRADKEMDRQAVESNLLKAGHINASITLFANNTGRVLIENGLGVHKGKTYTSSLSKLDTSKTTDELTELLLARVNNEFYGWAVRKGYRSVN